VVSLAVVGVQDLFRAGKRAMVRASEEAVDEIDRLDEGALQQSSAGRDPGHPHPQATKEVAAVARGASSVGQALEPSMEG